MRRLGSGRKITTRPAIADRSEGGAWAGAGRVSLSRIPASPKLSPKAISQSYLPKLSPKAISQSPISGRGAGHSGIPTHAPTRRNDIIRVGGRTPSLRQWQVHPRGSKPPGAERRLGAATRPGSPVEDTAQGAREMCICGKREGSGVPRVWSQPFADGEGNTPWMPEYIYFIIRKSVPKKVSQNVDLNWDRRTTR